MKKMFASALLALAISACAITGGVFGPTPEAQIATGARSVTAAATLATVLLKNNRITVVQAKSYSSILHTASGHLDQANATLVTCRRATGSTSLTQPDPCAPSIAADIGLAVSVVGEVSKTLRGKE